MKILLLSAFVALAVATPKPTTPPTTPTYHSIKDVPEYKEMDAQVNLLKTNLEAVSRQLMQQQNFVEERIRSDGMSGVKTIRLIREGTQPYYADTHIGGSALGIHDHPDYDRTIGMGEFVGVLNGVEFRTRHNDYKLRKPSHNHRTYDEVEDIRFPHVPGRVTHKTNITAQVLEMREWFKAFKEQNYHHRDYRNYFKANLCYLEGAWTLNAKTLNEPFQSDRHHIDATSWFDLQEKIRFTSYAGSKSNLENFAYLPTIMYNVTDGIPQFAQWNYRILCHPLKQQVPTGYFKLQDDLSARLAHKYTWDKMAERRAARFKINEYGTDRYNNVGFLDSLMAEIPGKNNYKWANMTDDAFGLMNYDVSDKDGNTPLNTAHYHRWFKLGARSAMGITVNHRGYHDENMWVAQTTQPNIMPMSLHHCYYNSTSHKRECGWSTRRVSYAIPLEIVYTTPLQTWNPYGLEYHDHNCSEVERNGRNGVADKAHAFNGTCYRRFYKTPVEFYKGNVEYDPANTARSGVSVLDKNGTIRQVAPSGFRAVTPNIEGVGPVRLRYPIFPVHSEGSVLGMELMAMKEMLMQMGKHSYLYESPPMGQAIPQDKDHHFHLRDSATNPPGLHGHDFTLTKTEFDSCMNGTDVSVTTSYNLAHQHELTVYCRKDNGNLYYRKCDGLDACWDKHSHLIIALRD